MMAYMETKKMTEINIKDMTREELEIAYELLRKISLQKTELIKKYTNISCKDTSSTVI